MSTVDTQPLKRFRFDVDQSRHVLAESDVEALAMETFQALIFAARRRGIDLLDAEVNQAVYDISHEQAKQD